MGMWVDASPCQGNVFYLPSVWRRTHCVQIRTCIVQWFRNHFSERVEFAGNPLAEMYVRILTRVFHWVYFQAHSSALTFQWGIKIEHCSYYFNFAIHEIVFATRKLKSFYEGGILLLIDRGIILYKLHNYTCIFQLLVYWWINILSIRYQSTRHNNPKDSHPHTRNRGNLISQLYRTDSTISTSNLHQ